MKSDVWTWDPTLFAGSAPYYSEGRVPYPTELADRLAAELALDRTGRLLDVGCGPGSLTLLMAPWFAEVVAVDADSDMLAEGVRRTDAAGVTNIRWVRHKAEDIAQDLGTFCIATTARSFHWMDRPRVAHQLYAVLAPDGALAHVRGSMPRHDDEVATPLAHPRVPR